MKLIPFRVFIALNRTTKFGEEIVTLYLCCTERERERRERSWNCEYIKQLQPTSEQLVTQIHAEYIRKLEEKENKHKKTAVGIGENICFVTSRKTNNKKKGEKSEGEEEEEKKQKRAKEAIKKKSKKK
ncbi:hypothetical protein RFI_03662 [Reticulomyxa filosa]|uniref:Uncharacterized protein n=1 Tax=Reticulomyxa filosa TaxID=46433 RepID=X6P4J0_RETFI|nr:hypothetical protein RFI_03662 [Reticulomyxa filosa]|eukprot:ETO33445.1 hypothetical protein RFI_03662 [Reticulomyxa filosa]